FVGHELSRDAKTSWIDRDTAVARVHASRKPFLVDQVVIQRRTAPTGEHHGQKIQGEIIRALEIRRVVKHHDEGQFCFLLKKNSPLSSLGRLFSAHFRSFGSTWNLFKRSLDFRQYLFGGKITGNHDEGVVGGI